MNQQIKGVVCFGENRKIFNRCYVSSFGNMIVNGGRARCFNTLAMFVGFQVLSTSNHKISRCFAIISDAAATIRKLVNNVRAQKGV